MNLASPMPDSQARPSSGPIQELPELPHPWPGLGARRLFLAEQVDQLVRAVEALAGGVL